MSDNLTENVFRQPKSIDRSLSRSPSTQHLHGCQLQPWKCGRDDWHIAPKSRELVLTVDQSTDHDPNAFWVNQPIFGNTDRGISRVTWVFLSIKSR
jgi:hypothetical protein